jgi:hypothetical protein
MSLKMANRIATPRYTTEKPQRYNGSTLAHQRFGARTNFLSTADLGI